MYMWVSTASRVGPGWNPRMIYRYKETHRGYPGSHSGEAVGDPLPGEEDRPGHSFWGGTVTPRRDRGGTRRPRVGGPRVVFREGGGDPLSGRLRRGHEGVK